MVGLLRLRLAGSFLLLSGLLERGEPARLVVGVGGFVAVADLDELGVEGGETGADAVLNGLGNLCASREIH